MGASPELGNLLVLLDAWPSPCRRVWDWPMNETSVVLEVSDASDRVRALLPEGSFPDGAGLCRVLKGVDQGCSGGCGACVVEAVEGEARDRFVLRTRRFCERLCERMVAYEDRFLPGFST